MQKPLLGSPSPRDREIVTSKKLAPADVAIENLTLAKNLGQILFSVRKITFYVSSLL